MAASMKFVSQGKIARQVLKSNKKTIFLLSNRLCSENVNGSVKKRKRSKMVSYEGGFRVFNMDTGSADSFQRKPFARHTVSGEPRFKSMDPNQDWTDVWPTAQSVDWSKLPFPVRQGFVRNTSEGEKGLPPRSEANLELMKIPNFLHLTPAHIIKHCAALKKFCTPWPSELKSEEEENTHFPLEISTFDYCFSGPSIRDPRSRFVVVQFSLSQLNLDDHAREKFIHLVGPRYTKETDRVKLIVDRCPTKKQNYDYAMYLLAVLYHESMKVEPWEVEKEKSDMLQYHWEVNQPKQNVVNLLQQVKKLEQESTDPSAPRLEYLPDDTSEEKLVALPQVQKHKEAVESLMNEDENQQTLSQYKDAVLALYNLQINPAELER